MNEQKNESYNGEGPLDVAHSLGNMHAELRSWLGIIPEAGESPNAHARMTSLSAEQLIAEVRLFLGAEESSPAFDEIARLPVGALLASFNVIARMKRAGFGEYIATVGPEKRLEIVKKAFSGFVQHSARLHQIRAERARLMMLGED